MWPQRFTEESTAADLNSGPECYGCYLVGLEWEEGSAEQMREEGTKITEGALRGVLSQFETRIRGDEKYFDANSCWLSTEIVRRSELRSVQAERRNLGECYGEHGMSDDESDSEDEDEDEDGDTDEAAEEEAMQSKDEQRCRAIPAPGKTSPRRGQPYVNNTVPGKFRTATDVMNRLRWDPSLDSSDYIIGYEDRFTGTREKRLELWKTEQTDEEFIPQHRILYFKRRSDGVIVWERKTRIDNVFGSGVLLNSDNGA